MDLISYCKAYHTATGLHLSVLREGQVAFSTLACSLGVPAAGNWELFPMDRVLCFCGQSNGALYGMVRIGDTNERVVAGPIFNIPLTSEMTDQMLLSLGLSVEMRSSLYKELCSTGVMHDYQLAKHLALIHFCLNGEPVEVSEIYSYFNMAMPEADGIQSRIDSLEAGELHNSYYYELELYQKVRDGNQGRLLQFIHENENKNLLVGKMAHDPLRQLKNQFIAFVSRTGFIGAIPGGLDVEKTYQLMDYYIRECEQLTTIESVGRLQYAMLQDLCRRTGESKRPSNISTDVWYCMNYVKAHLYESITLADLANSVHRSKSYVIRKFREELNIHVTAYINRCKLEEAQTLLIYSEKSIAQISSDLCFASQSYFQNLFKKQFGITPAKYRKRERII